MKAQTVQQPIKEQAVTQTIKDFFGDLPASFFVEKQNLLVRDFITNPNNEGCASHYIEDAVLSSNLIAELLVKLQEQISK